MTVSVYDALEHKIAALLPTDRAAIEQWVDRALAGERVATPEEYDDTVRDQVHASQYRHDTTNTRVELEQRIQRLEDAIDDAMSALEAVSV